MSDQFLAEVRILANNYAPYGWAFCNGQIMAISQNSALFSLLGTNFGGNGTTNFGLPNFQGRTPLHVGSGPGPGLSSYVVGEEVGTTSETITSATMAAHTHTVKADATPGSLKTPSTTSALSRSGAGNAYLAPDAQLAPMAPGIFGPGGTGPGPHNNLMPYLALNFCIALQGIYPQRP